MNMTADSSDYRLDLWLYNRRWWLRREPFPHLVAHNVFRPTTYEALEKTFHEILALGVSDNGEDRGRFSRNMKGYDAYGLRLLGDVQKPFSFFGSREWHDLIASLFDAQCTGDIEISLHHHPVGTVTGWLHNDLNPAWYVSRPGANGINFSDPEVCSYHYGTTKRTDVTPQERIRAIAILFYLANPPWRPGDGGETGIYKLKSQQAESPSFAMAPINNSMIAFECTPYSYHTFISNRRTTRNSLVMWLHRPKEDVIARWGEGSIEKWK